MTRVLGRMSLVIWTLLSMGMAVTDSAANLLGRSGVTWVDGKNFQRLVDARPKSRSAPVEVVEYFRYSCPHCFALEPEIEIWYSHKSPHVEFTRIPAIWSSDSDGSARLYYALEKLNRIDVHRAVFDAIHLHGAVLYSKQSPRETFDKQLAFVKRYGIAEQEFRSAYYCPEVDANVKNAEELTIRNGIESVPMVIINDAYSTNVEAAGSRDRLIELIDDIVAKEMQSRASSMDAAIFDPHGLPLHSAHR